MRRTSLHNVQLYRTDFTAYILLDQLFKGLTYAGKILVTEIVYHSRFISFASQLYSLGNGNDNCFMLCHLVSYVLKEFIRREIAFGEINKVRSYLIVSSQNAGGGSKPACVSSHYLDYRHRLNGINGAVADYFLYGCGYIFRRRAEAGSMIGHRKIVIYGFRDTYYSDF